MGHISYGVRVTIQVERENEFGKSEDLNLSFADFIDAVSASDAALKIAREIPARAERRLMVPSNPGEVGMKRPTAPIR